MEQQELMDIYLAISKGEEIQEKTELNGETIWKGIGAFDPIDPKGNYRIKPKVPTVYVLIIDNVITKTYFRRTVGLAQVNKILEKDEKSNVRLATFLEAKT